MSSRVDGGRYQDVQEIMFLDVVRACTGDEMPSGPEELQRGYMLRGALLRPARVVVGRFSGDRINSDEEPNPPENPPIEN